MGSQMCTNPDIVPSLFLPEPSAPVACASHLNGDSAPLFSLLLSDYFSVLVHKRKLIKARLCCCIAETRHSGLLVWVGGGKEKMAEADLGDVTQAPPTKQSIVIKREAAVPHLLQKTDVIKGNFLRLSNMSWYNNDVITSLWNQKLRSFGFQISLKLIWESSKP